MDDMSTVLKGRRVIVVAVVPESVSVSRSDLPKTERP